MILSEGVLAAVEGSWSVVMEALFARVVHEKVAIKRKMPVSFVYILSSHTRVLYVGMSGDLRRRVFEHKTKAIEGFTAKYHVDQLVYYEEVPDMVAAASREKQLKGWTRAKKIALIEHMNPHWFDLSDRWFEKDLACNVFSMATAQWDFREPSLPVTVQSRSNQDPSTTASTPSLRTLR